MRKKMDSLVEAVVSKQDFSISICIIPELSNINEA